MREAVEQDDDVSEVLVGRIADDFTDRMNRGERPDVEEYARRHPQLADVLRDVLPPLQAMRHSLSPGLSGRGVPAAAPAPQVLGEYRIIREIGRGGMGVVYEAEQGSLGRRVALKVLPLHAVMDPTYRQRFEREARTAAKLHHTNIVPVFGVGEQDGIHYYAMQFIDGRGLDEVLDDARRSRTECETTRVPSIAVDQGSDHLFEPSSSVFHSEDRDYYRTAARIGLQVADALANAHGQGVLHRDIKPSNLMLDEHGTVWVTDFGLAKTEVGDNLTQLGDIVGTLRYMAPERFSGRSDERSDVYSLGLTLYEMLTLQPAFAETDRSKLIQQITQTKPPAPQWLARRIPRDLETIVLKAIAKEPDRRYRTAADLAEDLRRFLADQPITARRAGTAERVWRWARRRPALATLAAALLLSLVGGLSATTWQWRRAEVNFSEANHLRGVAEANLSTAQDERFRAQAAQRDAERNHAVAEQEANRAEAEAERAIEQARRAEHFYRLAYDAVDELRDAVSDDGAFKQPALQPLQRQLLTRALGFYEQLIELDADDPKAKADLATNYARVGRIKRTTGPIQEAIQAYQKAVELFGEVAEAEPDVAPHREQLVLALNGLGFLIQKNGRFDEARRSFDRAVAVSEQLLRKQPDSAAALSGLAMSYVNLGYLVSQSADGTLRQRAERAIELHEKAQAIYEQLVRDDPESTSHSNDLAISYSNTANRMLDASRPQDALERFQKCLAIRLDRLRRDPKSFDARLDVAAVHRNLGSVYRRFPKSFQDWFEQGVPAYDKARELCEGLLSENPTHLGVHAELGRVFINLARIHRMHGDPLTALPLVERAIGFYESCSAGDPENVEALASLAITCNEKGMILEKAARPQEAVQAFERAVQLQTKVVEMAQQVKRYRDDLRVREANLARARKAAEPK